MTTMTGLVLVAAGSGQRLAAGVPKALVEVAGQTLIGHCLATVRELPAISAVVVVVPADQVEAVAATVPDAVVVAGGASRDASVRNGLAALGSCDHVLIHDAARPFTPVDVFARVIDRLRAGAVAVIPGLPVVDTIKRVRDGRVLATVDRADLVSVQTPQGFRVSDLVAAHAARTGEVTDDAMLMEQAGHPVDVVEGATDAFKITTQFDLAMARAMKEA